MNKADLIKKLESYSNDDVVTVLVNDKLGKPYIVDLVEVSLTKDLDGDIEILLVPDSD